MHSFQAKINDRGGATPRNAPPAAMLSPQPHPRRAAGTSTKEYGGSHGDMSSNPIHRFMRFFRDFVRNTDEQVVLSAKHFAFYRGRLVVRHSLRGRTSCAILGMIFLNRRELPGNPESIETVKHEYGHTVQESILGLCRYVKYIALPSMRSRDVPYEDYYSLPWEYTADLLGQVCRNGGNYAYHPNAEEEAADLFALLNRRKRKVPDDQGI